jgi:hypothetical protein
MIMKPESSPEPLVGAFPPTPPAKMTYEKFLAWVDEDTWSEWVDGAVILLLPASNQHQELVGLLTALLRHFVEVHCLGMVRALRCIHINEILTKALDVFRQLRT